ncbi:MAG: hypothetical protein V3T70_06870 [Phycisphaerae bacterium]
MHAPPEGRLTAHTAAEAYLFVSLTYCPHCRRRPVRVAGELQCVAPGSDEWSLAVECAGCGQADKLTFTLAPLLGVGSPRAINPTGTRSKLIDPAGWLALYQSTTDRAAVQSDRSEARALSLEAARFLDEALKFYEPGAELPDAACFLSEQSASRIREHPESFQRSRIAALRDRLPRR